MFDRIRRSWQLTCDSWGVLRSNKRFMMFPFLSTLAAVLVLISFAVPLYVVRDKWVDVGGGTPPWLYVVIFAFYLVNYFVMIFFNAALVHCALMKMNGEDPSVGDGIRAAMSRFPQILAWAVVSATVGLILKAIENAHEKAGYWISLILGAVWTAMTYFVVPVIVVEQAGPFKAIGRSTSIIKKTWGEAIIGHFGIGIISFLLFLPVLLLGMVTFVLWTKVGVSVGVMMFVVTLVAAVIWMAASSALSGIYLTALYQFAAYDKVPEGFSDEAMRGAFYTKK